MTTQPILSTAGGNNPAQSIYHQLRGLIMSGQLGADERLATVRQTAADLGVAPGTVAKAYKMLEQDGLVVSRTAAGTRVAASVAILPRSVITRIREVTEEASISRASLDDVISVLRALWPASGGDVGRNSD